MDHDKIERSKLYVIPIFMILFVLGGIESVAIKTEGGLDAFVLRYLTIPIIILSMAMAAYWVLITDEFQWWYEDRNRRSSTGYKMLGKFLLWTGGMFLCFFLVVKGAMSFYNRSVGEQKTITVTGRIIDKEVATNRNGRVTGYYFEMQDSALGRAVKLTVSKGTYNDYQPGNDFQTERKIGSLGYIYQ